MKIEYFETKSSIETPKSSSELVSLVKNKTILLLTTVQFLEQRDKLAIELLKHCKIISLKLSHCKYQNQILGCSAFDSKIVEKPDLFIYFGDGMFHPKSLILADIAEEVYLVSPIDFSIKKITKQDINSLLIKRKVALTEFSKSKNIGILITTKPGQNNLTKALTLKTLEKLKNKNLYFFLDDTINFQELENFNFIDSWINTACPRIAFDDSIRVMKPILNINELV